MKRTILLTIFLLSFIGSAFTQWTQSFENLEMYKVNINGLVNDEQALYASRLITECNNVLIARINEFGEGNIFTEGEVSFNEILTKLSVIPNIEISERYSVKPTFEDYIQTYNQYRLSPIDMSRTLPPAVKLNDPEKQSRAYTVFKNIWIETHPDSYNGLQTKSSDENNPEKIEKEKDLLNQKNN